VNYTFDFAAPVTLMPGNDRLSVDFGDGTTFGSGYKVYVNGNVTGVVTKVDEHLSFAVPAGCGIIMAGSNVTILVTKVVNPADGDYTACLDYQLVCCAEEPFCCVDYTIMPDISTYTLALNFSDTYPGIAYDFVPPFKACGQNDTDQDFDTTPLFDVWYTMFDIVIEVDVPGCAVPCENATLLFTVSGFPSAAASVNLSIESEWFTLNSTSASGNVTPVALNETLDTVLDAMLHFNEVGTYTICFEVICEGGDDWTGTCPVCIAPGEDITVVPEKCYEFEVHQWKDAFKIELDEKWNLISLPLVPFDPDIEVILASLSAAGMADLISIWNYDCVTPEWLCYTPDGGVDTLFEIVDGKSYWFRMDYPIDGTYGLWVWGTEFPEPYGPPAEYAVCEGWNMFGFTSLDPAIQQQQYLWNWYGLGWQPAPIVYGWTNAGDWNTQGWDLIMPADNLVPGQGYFGAFPTAGSIFQYVP
jgi:hypothetical protein